MASCLVLAVFSHPLPGDLAETPVPPGGLVMIFSIRFAKEQAQNKPKLHIFGDKLYMSNYYHHILHLIPYEIPHDKV